MSDTEMDLEQAHEFYKDPANLVPVGPGQRPKRAAAMSGLVPVRFPQETIAAVRRLADLDGMTVSSWIRRLVAKEIKRREPPVTATIAADPVVGVKIEGTPLTMTATSTDTSE